MGEVYRAIDTRLKRVVAIKILPAEASSDHIRQERFYREARAVSSLNHPHICSLYDVGHQDGVDFLVMEYCEGETLADRLAGRAMPLDQVLRIAIDVAEALAAAHRSGLIHRDLKPSNIMLTATGAKLLDFGVAKWIGPDEMFCGSPTLTARDHMLTVEGGLIGTLNYMAPEQLEGKPVDARADIFSLGAVLYEMASGQVAFAGTSRASVIAAILEREPAALRAVQPLTPSALERAVQKCLAKEPAARWQTADDLADELRWIAGTDSQAGARMGEKPSRVRHAWIAAGLFAFIATALGVFTVSSRLHRPSDQSLPIRFEVNPPPDTTFQPQMSVSPDGRQLAFVASGRDGGWLLWVRPMDSLQARPLPGTAGAGQPFWSPDSQMLGFNADGKLKKINISGGLPETIWEFGAKRSTQGASWGPNNIILAAIRGTGLFRLSANGGDPVQITQVDPSREEWAHGWPQLLPDGRHFLYRIGSGRREYAGIYVGSLDSQDRRRLVNVDSNPLYVEPGYLLFHREGALVAQSFNAQRLELVGQQVVVADQLAFSLENGRSLFAASNNGVLAFRGADLTRLTWVDRQGHSQGFVGPPGHYAYVSLSPDQKQLAVSLSDPNSSTQQVWLVDVNSGAAKQLTFDPSSQTEPIWSRDGRRVVFSSYRDGVLDLYSKEATGNGPEDVLFRSPDQKGPLDWSADGRYLLFWEDVRPDLEPVLSLLSLTESHALLRLGKTSNAARFSPDAHWIAYESGGDVYVRASPPGAAEWRVSSRGGAQPRWRADGKELFYVSDQGMMAAPITADGEAPIGRPQLLFRIESEHAQWSGKNQYVPSADGQRFLINLPEASASSSPIVVVINWPAKLQH